MKFLLLIFTLLPFYLNAEIKIVESYRFYKVATKSKSNILEDLNNASPIREEGNVFHGYTRYDIKWKFWWKSNNNKCEVTKVETNLKLKYTMPSLISSNSEIKVIWSNWYPNLEIHEKGHGDLAKDTAYKIDKKLTALGSKANCDLLKNEGNKIAYRLMANLKEANKIYDRKTNHGETQKAWIYMHL